ncbi:hypothetical protein [Isoptericola sp. 178]|uniref:hypothetical protein n=1 Tax=Isoptericola sp. 178 TaxID=3064651 RepID=UPI002713D618|nr:hypothetical protein [Isoptericola sp. 178]MDO8145737.1 hypothetical protein [Isoptericola sp. 178]
MRPLVRLVVAAVALLVTAAAVVLPTSAQAEESTAPTDTPLVLVGVAGLQWTDIDAARTPNLWRLVGGGSVASVSVRTLTPTCPRDAWLSLSAGSRVVTDAAQDPREEDAGADGDGESAEEPEQPCPPLPTLPAADTPTTVQVPGWDALVAEEALASPAARPGTLGRLADTVGTCTTAVGPGAALATADRSGQVGRFLSSSDDLEAEDLTACPVTVVDLGELPDAATERTDAVSAVDAAVGRIAGLLPAGGRLVVAGLADTPLGPADLQVVVDWTRPGGGATWLTSTSSRWPGVVVSGDLSATLADALLTEADPAELAAAEEDPDSRLAELRSAFTGSALERGEDRRSSVSRTVENRQYLSVLTETLPRMTPVLVGVLALGVIGVVTGLLLARRRAEGAGTPRDPWRTRTALAVLTVVACLPAAATLATLARWWVWPVPVTVLCLAVGVSALAVALGAWWVRVLLPRSPWRLPTTLAAATWLVLTIDGLTGTTLQQGSLLGPAPSLGARFYGFSNSVFAVYAVAGLVLAAGLAALLRDRGAARRTQAWVAGAVGTVTVLVDGLPPFGADLGGILALVPAFAVLVLGVAGIRLTWRRALLVLLGAALVVAVIAVLDWALPPATHLGGFVDSVLDGSALSVVAGKAAGAWATVANPAGAFAAVVCAAAAWAVLDPRRARLDGLTAAYDRDPLLRRAVVAIVTVGVVGTAVNDSGVVVAMYVLLIGTPLLLAGRLEAALTPPVAPEHADRGTGRRILGVAAGVVVALQLGGAAVPAGGMAHAGDVTAGGDVLLADGEPVVIVGTDGLRWQDVSPTRTPTLWGLLRDGASAGGMTTTVTGASGDCRSAGWLSLSAGRSTVTGATEGDVWRCTDWGVTADGAGAVVDGWDDLEARQSASEFNPHPGVLGETLAAGDVCATAVGPAAALTLADGDGAVERYRTLEDALDDPEEAFACPVTVVDAGSAPYHPTGEGSDARPVPEGATGSGPERDDALRAVDATVRRVLAAAPQDVTVLVTDMGNPSPTRPALGVGVARTHTDAAPSYLASSATRWVGVVRLLDLPPTLVANFDLAPPADFSGAPVTLSAQRPSGTGATVRDLSSLTERDHGLREVTGAVTGVPTYVALVAFALVVLVLPQLRRRSSPRAVRVWTRTLETVLLVCAAMPAASFLMTTWSWWRMPDPQTGLWLALAGGTVLVALVGTLAPRRPAWAGTAVLATVTFLVLSLDAVLGTPLHRGSPLGAAPTLGGRFYGFGNPTYSVYAVAAVLCAAGLATVVARRWGRVPGAVVAGLVGLVALVVTVWPTFGVDVGGGLVLVPVFAVVVLAVLGARLTWRRLALAGGAGVLLVAVIGVLDWLRPPAERSHLGAFVQSVVDGTAFETVWRKAGYAVGSLDGGPPAWLSLAVLLGVVAALWAGPRFPAGWLRRAEDSWPLLRPVLVALLIAGVGGALANDYGIRVVTIMLFPAVPLIGLLVLRTDDSRQMSVN